jgi:putative glutamine amidotransferase
MGAFAISRRDASLTRQDSVAHAPRIVVTLAVPGDQSRPDLAVLRNDLYLAALARHGAVPVRLDARTPAASRDDALQTMDGLLLSGGGDLDPSRYGQPIEGSHDIEPDRDELEATAWGVAETRQLPVFGICRGLQAINVFSGGSILQHVDGHAGPGWGTGPAARHPLRVVPGTRLAMLLGATETLEVNAYHHQGIREADLAPSLRPAAWADSDSGPLVEGLEGTGERFVVGVQCHPERTESTPAAFEQLFAAFVRAAGEGNERRARRSPAVGR